MEGPTHWALPESSSFAVVAGTARDQLVYPTADRGLIRAGRQAKAEARIALAGLRTTGEATMSACLALAGRILADGDGGDASRGTVRHATLVVVGPDEVSDPERDLVFDEFAGMFVCDGRGFGCNWSVKDLRAITAAFEGTYDICTDPASLTDGLRRIHDDYATKSWPAAELAILCQPGVRVAFLSQVEPQVKQLRVKTGTTYSIGPWAVGQAADFHLALDFDQPPGPEEVIVAGVTVSATASEEARAHSFVTVAGGDVQLTTRGIARHDQ